jgi:hypothetical protein
MVYPAKFHTRVLKNAKDHYRQHLNEIGMLKISTTVWAPKAAHSIFTGPRGPNQALMIRVGPQSGRVGY